MIKIAYIIQSWHLGGIETAIYNLTKYLSENTVDFEFYFIATDNPEIHPRYNKIGKAVYLGHDWKRITKYLKNNQIDILQWGNVTRYKECGINASVKVIIERIAGERSLGTDHSGITHMICSSEGIAKEASKLYDGSISVIKNGIQIVDAGIDRLGFKKDDFVVVYPAARMGDGQAYDDLIKAVIIAHRHNPKIKLILMGDTPNQKGYPNIKPKLKLLASSLGKDCVFTGFVSEPLSVINGSDVCVVPAKTHGISNALIEAASFEKPLIATDVGQTKEICINNENGFLVKVMDVSEMANRILYLSKNCEVCKEMGEKGLELVIREHDIETQSLLYRDLYLKLI